MRWLYHSRYSTKAPNSTTPQKMKDDYGCETASVRLHLISPFNKE